MKAWCVATGLWLLAATAMAQRTHPLSDPQPRFRNFAAEQGLPSSETYCVHQDRKGYIWIGTDRGVVRFDGYRLRVFKKEDGLPDEVIFHVYEDAKGRIWFVGLNSLLSYYENGKIIPYRYNDRIAALFYKKRVVSKSLFIRKDGTIMYGFMGMGMLVIRPDGTMDKSRFKSNKDELEISFIGKECLFQLFGSIRNYLSSEKEKSPLYLKLPGQERRKIGMISPGRDLRFQQFGNRIYFIIDRNLSVVSGWSVRQLTTSGNAIALHIEGNSLWLGTTNGVTRYHLSSGDLVPKKQFTLLHDMSVSGIESDRNGGYWFSTLEKGVFYTSSMAIRNYSAEQGLSFLTIPVIGGVGKDVYVRSKNGQYQQLNTPWNVALKAIGHERYYIIRCGKELFFSGYHEWKRPGSAAALLPFIDVRETNGITLALERNRVYKIVSGNTVEEVQFSNPLDTVLNSYFQQVAADDRGRVWLGGVWGVEYVQDKRLQPLKGHPLFNEPVSDMCFDSRWKNVVATPGKGVYCHDNGKLVWHFTANDFLPGNTVNSVCTDNMHRLWVATNDGVSLLTLSEKGEVQVMRFNIRNGLISNEVNEVYCYGNLAWIATKNGVSRIDLGEYALQSGQGKLWLESVSLPGDKHYYSRFIPAVDAGTDFIRIVLRNSDYRAAAVPAFRYRFQADEEWVYGSAPEILLNNPNAGTFRCEVSYRKPDGSWSVPEVLCEFVVNPPFYATWYFITLLFLIGAGGMYVLFRLRLRQLKRRHYLQDKINQLEQKALRAQMNPHFIFNSLNSIQSFLIYEENEKAERYLLRFAHLIRMTLNNSREPYIAVESEMDSLQRYLELEQMRFKDKFTFEIRSSLTPEELRYGVPPMLIQPFVENAVLHGFKTITGGGKITVHFEAVTAQGLDCSVEDNGIGRKATLDIRPGSHKSFGTRITEERLVAFRQKYGDDFRITITDKEINGQATGTLVRLRVPVAMPGEWKQETEQ